MQEPRAVRTWGHDPPEPPGRHGQAEAAAGGGKQPPAERTASLLLRQAVACEALGSPLYAGLLRYAAADLLAGGPTAAVLDGHLLDPGRSALALRMLGGAHALALTGQAEELAAFYPSAGGTADAGPGAELAWPALRRVLAGHTDWVRSWLERPPQTNEVGRGAALVGALCHVVAEVDLPIRLVEIGASAGLNLRADRFWISGAGVAYGNQSSPVRMADGWLGKAPPVRRIEVAGRTGGDLEPIDPLTDCGQLRLTAYVWPDQVERLRRLRGAFELAARVPAELREEPASTTVTTTALEGGSWTVLWHSIMRQYLDQAEIEAVEAGVAALAAAATPAARFARVTLELIKGTADTPVELVTWPGGARRRLGTASPHGVPVTWS